MKTSRDSTEDIKAFLRRVLQLSGGPGISVALNIEGTTFAVALGCSDTDTNAFLTVDSRFELGCIKKLLVAAIVLELGAERLIDLNAPISRYLPELAGRNGDSIVVRHLLTFTAGYQDVNVADPDVAEGYTYEVFARTFNDRRRLFEPGTVFSYSHTASALLGKIVEAVTARDAWQLIDERILQELQVVTRSDAGELLVSGHRVVIPGETDEPLDRFLFGKATPVMWSDFWKTSLGGPCATARDVVTIGAALAGEPDILSAFARERLLSCAIGLPNVFPRQYSDDPPISFGFGCERYTTGAYGLRSFSTPGQALAVRFDADHRIAVAVGMNSDSHFVADFVITKLFDALTAHERTRGRPPPRSDSAPPSGLENLAVIYDAAQFHRVVAHLEEDRLELTFGYNPAINRDTTEPFIAVRRSEDGNLTALDRPRRIAAGFFRDPVSREPCLFVDGLSYRRLSRDTTDASAAAASPRPMDPTLRNADLD